MTRRNRLHETDTDILAEIYEVAVKPPESERLSAPKTLKYLEEKFPGRINMSEDSVLRRINDLKTRHDKPKRRLLDSTFEWHLMEEYGLPWEASGFIMDMLKDALYSRAWLAQSDPKNAVPLTTTVRDVFWWWRVHQAAPEIPEGVGSLHDIQLLAAQFAFREMTHELLATPMETADLEARLALKPWLDADHHRRYHVTVDLGVVPAIARPEITEISRAIAAGVQKQVELQGWLDGTGFGILLGHLELLYSQQIAVAQVHQKIFTGGKISEDELENVLWAATPAREK